jgi:hypothetical protein
MRIVVPEVIDDNVMAEDDHGRSWVDIPAVQWETMAGLLAAPSVRGALEALSDRLLGGGWTAVGTKQTHLRVPEHIERHLASAWTHFVRRLLGMYFAYGLAVVGVHEDERGMITPYCVEPSLIRLQIFTDPNGPPTYRVGRSRQGWGASSSASLTGEDEKLRQMIVCEMSPPTFRGALDSPATSLAQIMVWSELARVSAVQAWMRAAVGVLYTEPATSASAAVGDPTLDVLGFGDAMEVRERAGAARRQDALNGAAPAGFAPLDSNLVGGGAEAGDAVTVANPQQAMQWTMAHAALPQRIPAVLNQFGQFIPPVVALPPGQRVARGPVPAALADLHTISELESRAVSMATGMPIGTLFPSSGSGHTTMVATSASVSQLDNVVRRYAQAVAPVLEFMLDRAYRPSALAERALAGELPVDSVEALMSEAVKYRFEVVFMTRLSMEQLDALFLEGSLSPETYREHVARTLQLPEADLARRPRPPPEELPTARPGGANKRPRAP